VTFATLRHEVESSQELCDTLQLKLKEAGLMAGLASADISIVDRGIIPARPTFPKKAVMLPMALFIGLFCGLVLAFVLESLDDSLETMEEVEAASSLPALAAIPFVAPRELPHNGTKRRSTLTAAALRPGSLMEEAYQVICNSLLLSSADHPPRTLVVTSALPGEGKSTTSCNLAITLAQRGGKVLLVDTDLRRSTLPFELGLDSKTTCGLSSILTGGNESDAIRNPIPELPNLSLILAGPQSPCPTQLLVSNKMTALLDQWATEYDHVVIDTTPVLYVADGLPLAARADAVLLVVRSGRSRRKAFIRMCNLLHRTKANLVGVVINGANLQLEPYAHSYYGQGQANDSN
jgi:capsular exopolysaccharide synthesis family protein